MPPLLRLRGGQQTADRGEVGEAAVPRRPGLLSRLLSSAPVTFFRSSPPITRSWVSSSVLLTILASNRLVDLRSIAFSEREVLRRGQWWRMLLNFFYMGDQPLSIFYWLQIYHLWECMRILELVQFAWEPGAFVRMILLNIGYLLVLKQMAPSLMFLGTPLVMVRPDRANERILTTTARRGSRPLHDGAGFSSPVLLMCQVFMYVYSREYESSLTNFLGFFQIRTGWLPFAQMVQDGLQTGDAMPNVLGLLAGHYYFYTHQVAPRLLLPKRPPSLSKFLAAMDKSYDEDAETTAANEVAVDGADTDGVATTLEAGSPSEADEPADERGDATQGNADEGRSTAADTEQAGEDDANSE
eukprot:scaffold143597_cov30-Tisochrysis_lutea.AAC.3